VNLLPGSGIIMMPLTVDRQQPALDGDRHVADPDTGQLGKYQVCIVALRDIDRRCPGRAAHDESVIALTFVP
jgi:hypothetical protein